MYISSNNIIFEEKDDNMRKRIVKKFYNGMVSSLNVNEEAYDMMWKTKRIFSAGSIRSNTTCQKILPFLTCQKKDKVKEMETEFSESCPSDPPRTRPFLRSSFFNEPFISTTNDPESFHCAIGPILAMAELFGVFAVSGIRAPTPLKLKFAKFSLHTAYATFITMMVLIMAILSVIHMIRTLNSTTFEVQGGVAAATAGAIFYGNSVIGSIIFLWLSPRWVTLQRDWRAMEQFIDSNKMNRPKLRWKFYLITGSILILALLEHLLSIAVNTVNYDWKGSSENSTFQNFLQIYCASSHAFILDLLKYNFVLGIFIFIVSKLATFTWNFTDVFVILVSTGLAERYKSLNKQVMASASKQRATMDWCGIREDYAALSSMVKKVDNDITSIIFLSFANNLYFICLQLLNGLSQPDNNSIVNDIYFFGSFMFLIGRTVTVTLFTARINDQSKVILPVLYTCSASTYNVETERLIYLLTTDDIALTGLRFFSITRNFMLAVAGAIVTYEVVLLQFNVAINNQPDPNSILRDIYFFRSFMFLIGWMAIVTLLTARINDQSKVVLPVLYTCSASTYNVEINNSKDDMKRNKTINVITERLIDLLTTDDIVLTGMRFFFITRNFMLAVAGAIVTYEVMLLQFNVAINK